MPAQHVCQTEKLVAARHAARGGTRAIHAVHRFRAIGVQYAHPFLGHGIQGFVPRNALKLALAAFCARHAPHGVFDAVGRIGVLAHGTPAQTGAYGPVIGAVFGIVRFNARDAAIFYKGAKRALRAAVHHAAGIKALLARAIRRQGGGTGQTKGQAAAHGQDGCSAKRSTPFENLTPGHFPVREQRRDGVGIFFHHIPHSVPQRRQGNLSPLEQGREYGIGASPGAMTQD